MQRNGGGSGLLVHTHVRDRFTGKIMAADARATLCVSLNERGRPMKLQRASIKAKQSVALM